MAEIVGAVGDLTGPALARAERADSERHRNTAQATPPPPESADRLATLLAHLEAA